MPGLLSETKAILRWIRSELGTGAYVNVMDQYRPAGKVGGGGFSEIDRRVTREEYDRAQGLAMELGLRLDRRIRR
jgi:putative pyruvate formate lyase activating enzyme